MSNIIRNIKQNPYVIIGGILLIFSLFAAIFAPLITAYAPTEINTLVRLQPPSSLHLLGTDQFGRDILSRVVYGARNSLFIGLSVVFLATFLGSILGLIAGYFKKLDNIIMRCLDGMMAFPSIIIAIVLVAVLGPGKINIIVALSFANFPRMARVVRSSVIIIKELEYVDSARVVGARSIYIIIKYILVNSISPIIVQATFIFAVAILDEAALSFLGVGINATAASWGGMVSEGQTYMNIAPWVVFFPGGAIVTTVLGLNLLGDGIRDMLDPRLKF